MAVALQVGTNDGRVRLLGRQGVEHTLYSICADPYATAQLEFWNNRGLLMRLSEVRDQT